MWITLVTCLEKGSVIAKTLSLVRESIGVDHDGKNLELPSLKYVVKTERNGIKIWDCE